MSLILVTRDEDAPGICLLTLNRPEAMNSYNMALHTAMVEAIKTADADPSIRVIVITGAGRAFCAGADISGGFGSAGVDAVPEMHEGVMRDAGGILNLAIFECDTPIIAAVNGAAVGIGATMLCPMDIRIGSNKAKYAFPFARRGIVCDGAASWFLPRLVGFAKANEWILKASFIPAEELQQAGFFSEICDPEDVLPRALELARDIAVNCSPTSTANNKRLLRASMLGHGALDDAPFALHMMESAMLNKAFVSPDCAEGVKSFLEKRPPEFKDRQD
jgi:enoyl-CoA hydratase/carnithine racemase